MWTARRARSRVNACGRTIGAGFALGLVLAAPAAAQKDDSVSTGCDAYLSCTHEAEARAPVLRAGVIVDTGLGGRIPRTGWVAGGTTVRRTLQVPVPAGPRTYRTVVDVHEASRSGDATAGLQLIVGGDGLGGESESVEVRAPGRHELVLRFAVAQPSTVRVRVELYAGARVDPISGGHVCASLPSRPRPPWPPIPPVSECVEKPDYAMGVASARLTGTIGDLAVEE